MLRLLRWRAQRILVAPVPGVRCVVALELGKRMAEVAAGSQAGDGSSEDRLRLVIQIVDAATTAAYELWRTEGGNGHLSARLVEAGHCLQRAAVALRDAAVIGSTWPEDGQVPDAVATSAQIPPTRPSDGASVRRRTADVGTTPGRATDDRSDLDGSHGSPGVANQLLHKVLE